MNHGIRTGFLVLLLALGANNAGAHHSTAVFTMDKVVELRGVVVDFKLRSPHSSFVVDARTFADGQQGATVERWEIESEALPVLRTMGIDANTSKPGDAVRIMASPHRDASFKFAHAQVLVAADSKEYGFASTNRVFSPSLRGVLGGGAAQAPAAAAPSAVGVQRLAGRWQAPLPIMDPNGESPLPLNEAGLAARRASSLASGVVRLVLNGGDGDDIEIQSFTAGGGSEDAIDFIGHGYTFEWLIAHSTEVGGDTVLDLGDRQVTIKGVSLSALHQETSCSDHRVRPLATAPAVISRDLLSRSLDQHKRRARSSAWRSFLTE